MKISEVANLTENPKQIPKSIEDLIELLGLYVDVPDESEQKQHTERWQGERGGMGSEGELEIESIIRSANTRVKQLQGGAAEKVSGETWKLTEAMMQLETLLMRLKLSWLMSPQEKMKIRVPGHH